MSLASLDGINGFRLDGVASDDNVGSTVSSAGDFNGDDSDIILDFENGKDKIDLSNYTKSDGSKITFNDLSRSAPLSITKSGGDVKITGFDSGDDILIRNIADTNITADDFIFGA